MYHWKFYSMGTCMTDLVLLSVRQSEAWIGCLGSSDVWLWPFFNPTKLDSLRGLRLLSVLSIFLDWWGCGRGMVWIQECSHCLVSELSFVSVCLFSSHPPLHWFYPFSRVCWMMSLSLCLDSDRHCVTSCLQTHRLWDNITVAHRGGSEGGWKGEDGGRVERQMYRQIWQWGMGNSLTSITGWLPWSSSVVAVRSLTLISLKLNLLSL